MDNNSTIPKPRRWVKRAAITVGVLILLAVALLITAKRYLKPELHDLQFSGSEIPGMHNCLWIGPVTYSQFNVAYPDEGAIYWPTVFKMPAGATLEITSDFPRLRYFSFHSYDSASRPYDSVYDEQLQPESGGNPFTTAGAEGRYKITVKQEKRPDGQKPDPNVLYLGDAGAAARIPMILRHYVPETGSDLTGGAGLPEVILITADGRRLKGQQMCEAIGSPQIGSANRTISTPTIPELLYKVMLMLPGNEKGHPARSTPEWLKFWGSKVAVQRIGPRNTIDKSIAKSRAGELPIASGFYANRQADYITSYINQEFGDVLVLKGKLPKTPATGWDWARGDYDMRYWSMCTNESLVTTRFASCVYDSNVIVDDQRNYTIVVSTKANRPSNATRECGITWLDWGEFGDGVGNANLGLLIMRNILPHRNFHQAIQNMPAMDGAEEFMGPYQPKSKYTGRKAFESTGCKETSP